VDFALGIRPGAENLEKVTGGRPEYTFGHVAAAGVARA
jgi:hypothetical protein